MTLRRRKTRAQLEREAWERQISEQQAEREAEIAEREQERQRQEAQQEDAIQDRLRALRIHHEAQKRLNSEVTRQRPFELPAVGWTAADFLEESDEPLEQVVESLHFQGNNTLLVAEFKTGKTTLEVNLASALADNKQFLDRFPVNFDHGNVALLNYEMDERQFRVWLNDSEIENVDRIIPLNLRGWQLPFWNEEEMLRLSEWLLQNEIKFMIMDPAARAWRGLVEHEGDNVQLAEFFGSLDELKRLGGVPNLLISTHTPRSADGRARGGGEIEAWPDGNWYLNKDQNTGIRSMRAEGRDVVMPATDLMFDAESRWLSAGGATETRVVDQAAQYAVDAVQEHGVFPSTARLVDAMKGKTAHKRKGIAAAVDRGLLVVEPNGQAKSYSLPPED